MRSPQNIAVLGAGIMGLCVALQARQAGHAVTLFDPAGFPARNASAMAGGMLAPYSEIEHMPASFIAAAQESVSFWKEYGADFTQNGSLFITHEEDRYILERFRAHLPNDIGQTLTKSDLEKLEPQLAQKFSGGFFLPTEAHLDPQKTIGKLIEILQGTGAALKTQTCTNENDYDLIVDCTGYAASGQDQELRGVKGETVIVRNLEFSLSRPIRLMHPRYPLYIVPREDNVFMIGATVIEGAGQESVSVRSALELLSAAYSLHPSFGEAEILDIRAGIRPAYTDNLPKIRIDGKRISCNGLFRHGFLLAPVMAQALLAYIDGEAHQYMSLFNHGENNERNDQRRSKNIPHAA